MATIENALDDLLKYKSILSKIESDLSQLESDVIFKNQNLNNQIINASSGLNYF